MGEPTPSLSEAIPSAGGWSIKVLIVEPVSSGHHSFYLRLILRAFAGHQCHLLTSPVTADLQDMVAADGFTPARVVEIPDGRPGPAVAAAVEYVRREPFDLVFIPFIDLMLRHLTKGAARDLGRVAGIWMTPDAMDDRYRFAPPIAKRPRIHGRVHRWLRRPETARHLSDLFFLVQRDVDRLNRIAPDIRGYLLDDPPEAVSALSASEAREQLGLPSEKQILLHAGSAGRRKGLGVLLDAYRRVEKHASVLPFLYRVGPNDLKPRHRQQLEAMITQGRAASVDRYVSTMDLADAFMACDWVAMPYRRFRHSSGVLGLARVANRPVVAPDYGYIGERVRNGQPGRLYRQGSTRDLARVLATLGDSSIRESVPELATTSTAQLSVRTAHDAFVESLSDWMTQIDPKAR